MYVDIASFFNCVYQEFLGAGSVLFEKRKKEYLQGAYGIRDVAQRYSTQVYLPMNGTRPNTWLKPLSVVESDKLVISRTTSRHVLRWLALCVVRNL